MKKLLLCISFFTSILTHSQTQKGLDIDGEAADDYSGWTVSMPDENTLAIGAYGNGEIGFNSGHVRIYEWNGTAWSQKGLDIDGEAGLDESGRSVSMPDANTVAIGAPWNDGNGSNSGHVRIYEWNGTTWTQKGIDIEGEALFDESGFSVSMPDASTVAIGAPYNDDNVSESGHVRIYEWSGAAWVQKGLDIDGEAESGQSGESVSMPDANTVAIGTPLSAENGDFSGQVRIYEWNDAAWMQKGSDINGASSFDFSGNPVSMPDANTVAIGAYGNDGNGSGSGHVRIYEWDGIDWIQKGSDIYGEAGQDESGWSVSMPNANTVAIGAYRNDGNGSDAGHVRIYSWNGTAWSQISVDIDGEASDDYSGVAVSMPDEYTVAVGAFGNDGNGSNSGHVRVYTLCGGSGSSSSTQNLIVCDSLVSPSGSQTWTTNGTYVDIIPNAAGCDSIMTFNLIVNSVSNLNTSTSGPTIFASNFEASYQWLDCDNDYAMIDGEISQIFTAEVNGNYAVELTENGCVDTTACVTIVTVGIVENTFGDELSVYPNPTNGNFSVDLGTIYETLQVLITDISGKRIDSKTFSEKQKLNLSIEGAAGLYFVSIQAGDKRAFIRLIKE